MCFLNYVVASEIYDHLGSLESLMCAADKLHVMTYVVDVLKHLRPISNLFIAYLNTNPRESMFHLITGLFKQLTAETVYSILIVGLDNAGKTSFFDLVSRYDYESDSLTSTSAQPTIPTVGLNVTKVPVAPGSLFQLWDLGGQESLRPLWSHYMSGASAVVFLIDGTDTERFPEVKKEVLKVLHERLLEYAPVLFLINKQDMAGCVHEQAVVQLLGISEGRNSGNYRAQLGFSGKAKDASDIAGDSEDLEAGMDRLAWDRDVHVMRVSCKTGMGIQQAIEWLRDRVRENVRREVKSDE